MDGLCAGLVEYYDLGLPVDVLRLSRCLGLSVYERAWSGLPHAISVIDMRIIILNSERSLQSRRFDLAHELAHFVLPANGKYHSDRENRFAAALLMPSAPFKLEWLVSQENCRQVFQVSKQAAVLRAKELGWRG